MQTRTTHVRRTWNTSAATDVIARTVVRESKPSHARAVSTVPVRRHAAPVTRAPAAASSFPNRLTLVAGLGLMLLAVAVAAGPLLRSRLQSRGLSNQLPTRRGGIRYRD